MVRGNIKQNILTIVLVAIVVFTIILWAQFFSAKSDRVVEGTKAADDSAFVLIEVVKKLKLDTSVLNDPRLGALEDVLGGHPAPQFQKGRINPFGSF